MKSNTFELMEQTLYEYVADHKRARAKGCYEKRRGGSFFFQAKDGIRSAQESRGLGDVYERKVFSMEGGLCEEQKRTCTSVPYTHLTLPTNREV